MRAEQSAKAVCEKRRRKGHSRRVQVRNCERNLAVGALTTDVRLFTSVYTIVPAEVVAMFESLSANLTGPKRNNTAQSNMHATASKKLPNIRPFASVHSQVTNKFRGSGEDGVAVRTRIPVKHQVALRKVSKPKTSCTVSCRHPRERLERSRG